MVKVKFNNNIIYCELWAYDILRSVQKPNF